MPQAPDHPLRLARIRAGLGPKALADRSGVSRSTVQAIEEGRTRTVMPETYRALAHALSTSSTGLEQAITKWHRIRDARRPDLKPTALAVLHLPPAAIPARFSTFQQWREAITSSPTEFASVLGMNAALVARYEQGIRVNGMPDTLSSALVQRLGINDEYLLALQRLEPSRG